MSEGIELPVAPSSRYPRIAPWVALGIVLLAVGVMLYAWSVPGLVLGIALVVIGGRLMVIPGLRVSRLRATNSGSSRLSREAPEPGTVAAMLGLELATIMVAFGTYSISSTLVDNFQGGGRGAGGLALGMFLGFSLIVLFFAVVIAFASDVAFQPWITDRLYADAISLPSDKCLQPPGSAGPEVFVAARKESMRSVAALFGAGLLLSAISLWLGRFLVTSPIHVVNDTPGAGLSAAVWFASTVLLIPAAILMSRGTVEWHCPRTLHPGRRQFALIMCCALEYLFGLTLLQGGFFFVFVSAIAPAAR